MLSGVEEACGEFLGGNRQSDFAGAQKAGREAVWGGERRSGRAGAHKELRPAMKSITWHRLQEASAREGGGAELEQEAGVEIRVGFSGQRGEDAGEGVVEDEEMAERVVCSSP
jgi:hypothetical protein